MPAGAAGFDIVASELESIARHLRAAGNGELARELHRAVNDAAKPVVRKIRDGLAQYMPARYAEAVSEDLAISVIRSYRRGDNPHVTVRVTARPYETSGNRRARRSHTGRKVGLLNAGQLTHPLWGDREHWRTQRVTPGFVSVPCRREAPAVREAIIRALEDVSVKAAAKGP